MLFFEIWVTHNFPQTYHLPPYKNLDIIHDFRFGLIKIIQVIVILYLVQSQLCGYFDCILTITIFIK